MKLKRIAQSAAIGATTFGLLACGGPVENNGAEVTPDGQKKERSECSGAKCDAWNWINNPRRFRTELTYEYAQLKEEAKEGYTDNEVWPDTYWPTYKDNLNQRWQGDDILAPAEKYDKAFNDWEPEGGFEEFMSLQPYDTDTCEWDEEYYDQLGPAATKVAKEGNWRAHNGRDDDGDGLSDKEECGWGDKKDYDGVETWWGLCHAWAPAAIMEEEPKRPVTITNDDGDEVTFEVADIKGLLVDQYDRASAHMIGGRCNESDVERDDTGRIPKDKCRDVNAGSFHVIMTNFLGLKGRPILEDRTYDYEVWNQPIIGYKITKQQELELDEVKDLLNTSEERDENSVPETEDEKTQVLKAANTLTEEQLTDEAGLRSEKAKALVTHRSEDGQFDDIDSIEEQLGTRSLSRLLNYAYEQEWIEEEPAIYSYNENAERFIEVEMDVDYVTESHASTEPKFPEIEKFTRTDSYHYILELEDGKIIGGEWVGRSIETHPDFLWLPTSAGGGNPNIDIATVRELLAKSTGEEDAMSEYKTYSSEETTEIPDRERGEDPVRATSTLSVDAAGSIKEVVLNLNIEHTYRGDLGIVLEKDGTEVKLYSGSEVDEPWKDNIEMTGKTISGFGGAEAAGDWKLHVVDTTNRDSGQINSWSLKLRTTE